jgi:hypothetical protein
VATKLYLRNDLASYSNLPTSEQSSLTADANLFTGETGAANRRMSTSISTSAQSNLTNASTADAAAHNYYIARWVSPQLNQTSIAANTWTLEFAAKESNTAANFPRSGAGALHVCAYVWKPSNGTKYGNIIDGNTNADFEEAGTTQTVISGTFSGAAVSSLTAGDAVIVVELWAIVTQGNTTTRTQDIYYNGTTENSTTNEAAFLSTPENLVLLPDVSLSRVYKYNVLQQPEQPSLTFDGVNDIADCGNHSDLWSQALSKFSFSCWIYPTAGWDGSFRSVVVHGAGVGHRFQCYIDDSVTGEIGFQVRNSVNGQFNALSTGLSLNQWNHVVGVYDNSLGSANIKIYVNKVVGATTANLTESPNLSAILALADTSTDFKGDMKDFRFWKDKALTQTEIDNIHANNSSAPTPDYWLKLAEGTGSPTDSISGTKTATLTGSTWTIRSPGPWRGLERIYKYNMLGRVSLSRTYLWNIVAAALERVSLVQIYKYNVIGRISLARIYKYHLASRVSLSRIYKYNILSRVTLSRIYKYNLAVRVSLARIYKYNVRARVSLSRIYKYNVIGRISLSRIYKYNVIGRISLARIYKYNVRARVSLARIYKYNLLARVSLARVYLWNVIVIGLTRISKPQIYKYHIANRVSLARIYKYNLATRVSLQRIYKYNVLARLSLLRVYKYNVIGRISLARIYKYNLQARVSLSRIYRYNVIGRISLARIYKYHVAVRTSLSRVYKYNVIARVSLVRVYKWNILSALTRISKQQIYKYHLIGRIALARIYKYNVATRVSLSRIYKYNVLVRSSLSRIYKYHIATRVSLARVYKYNVIQRLSLARVYKWNLLQRFSLSRIYKWNVLLGLTRISKEQVYKYNIIGRLSKPLTLRYNLATLAVTQLGKVVEWIYARYQEDNPPK